MKKIILILIYLCLIVNGTLLSSHGKTVASNNRTIYIFGANNNPSPVSFSTRILAGYTIGEYLTAAEITILYNAWAKLNTAVGR